MWSIGEKIEAIRREPEQVRMRYVMLCVTVGMVFIVGLWLLSVHENIAVTAKDLPKTIEQGKKDLSGGSTPSLNDLFQQSAPLRIEEKSVNGSQFYNQEQQNRSGVPDEQPQLNPSGQ